MNVNTNRLKDNIDKLNIELNNYSNIKLNYYNELNNSSSYGNSIKIRKFYTNVSKEKIYLDDFIEELNELKSIYDYIYNSYNNIGNNIEFDLNNDTTLFNKINLINNKINSIKRSINFINLSTYPEITKEINSIILKLNNMQKNLNIIEKHYKTTINKINEIEKQSKIRLNKLDFKLIQEIDLNEFI